MHIRMYACAHAHMYVGAHTENMLIHICICIQVHTACYTCNISCFPFITPAPPNVAPSNFRVIDATTTSVTFQWDALSDEQANGVVQQYVITCTEISTNTEVSKIEAPYLVTLEEL